MLPPHPTIAALSSGRLPSAIAVIRLSGPDAFAAINALLNPPQSNPSGQRELALQDAGHPTAQRLPPPRQAALRRLYRPFDGAVLDEAIVIRFPAPASATGEDVAELHVHGSPAVVAVVLEALQSLGVRQAEPGEFTRRAFEAGRLDLTQVEGLADLLAATTEAQRVQAAAQADGALRRFAERWRAQLIELLASVEAQLDFSDEEDAAVAALDHAALARLASEFASALSGFSAGERIREGLTCAITGAPNVGKSSLFNALLARDAAIVSPAPGTTRDLIEAQTVFAGIPVTLIDTAGLRDAADPIEAEGIERARARAASADIVVAVSAGEGWPGASPGALRILNKTDLPGRGGLGGDDIIAVSAVSGAGLDFLRSALENASRRFSGSAEPALVTRGRQRAAIVRAQTALTEAQDGVDPTLVAESLRSALSALSALVGRTDADAMLGTIFGRFCIGK